MKRGAILMLILTALSAGTARADDYLEGSGRKLGRGLANTTLGWTEVFKSQERIADERGPIAGLFWGTVDGLGNGIKRTAAGVYETATFPIKTSANTDPVLEPEFPIESDHAGYRPKDYTF